MKKRLTIALVAHDKRKADMVEWAKFNATLLSKHKLVCTGTTGGLVRDACKEIGIDADIECMNSGPQFIFLPTFHWNKKKRDELIISLII